MSKMFKMLADGLDISLQQYTSDVPNDGKYYLLRGKEIIKSYRGKSQAIKAFRTYLKEVGYAPPESKKDMDAKDLLNAEKDDIEFYRSEMYWGRSHQYRGGGKLGNR